MTMGNLWQFFGLPDPDAGGAARVAEAPATAQNRQLSNEPVAVETQIVEETLRLKSTETSPSNGMDQ